MAESAPAARLQLMKKCALIVLAALAMLPAAQAQFRKPEDAVRYRQSVMYVMGTSFYSRLGAVLVAVNMIFAIVIAHRPDVLKISEYGGWAIELQAMYLVTAIALALMGPGRFGINDR